jgi:hypothetical protein
MPKRYWIVWPDVMCAAQSKEVVRDVTRTGLLAADMVVDETIPEPDDSCLSTEPFTKN